MHLFIVEKGVAVVNHVWLPGFVYCQGLLQKDILDEAQAIVGVEGAEVTEELMQSLDEMVVNKLVEVTGCPEVREVLEATLRLPDKCMCMK
jgi:hypothetical protein